MRIEWAVYGELNKGHALLAASGPRAFAAQLTQHMDRPGDPPAGQPWGPVESGFPFHENYICLRTLPDTAAGRPGMVRSYAAFLPLSEIGVVQNIGRVFALLPALLMRSENKLAALEIPDADLHEAPAATPQLSLVATQIGLNGTVLPIVWSAAESYLPTVAALWARLPAAMRATFAFSYQFTPEHRMPGNPWIVATAPGLGNRWPAAHQLRTTPTVSARLNVVQRWLGGHADASDFEQALGKYEITLTEFKQINLLAEFAELTARLPSLTLAETRRAIMIMAVHARPTAASAAARLEFFHHLSLQVESATVDDLLTLRNLDEKSLADLIAPLQEAIKSRLAALAVTGKPTSDLVGFLELGVAAADAWWSRPIFDWLQKEVVLLKGEDAALSVRLFESAAIGAILAKTLPRTAKAEEALSEALSKTISPSHAERLLALAAKRDWMRLHATALTASTDADHAVLAHSAVAGANKAGFDYLFASLGAPTILRVACENDHPVLTRYSAGLLALDLATLPKKCAGRTRLLKAALDIGNATVTDAFRASLHAVLSNPSSSDTDFGPFCLACANFDPALFAEVANLSEVLDRLPEQIRDDVSARMSDFVGTKIRTGQPVKFASPDVAGDFISAEEVLAILHTVPISACAAAGVNAFESLPFLSDADCRMWLIDYFTRTAHHTLPAAACASVGALLFQKDFPETAKMVRETVEKFYRLDVTPIDETIRHKYQVTKTYERQPTAKPARLPRVVIATALPLERDEVIRFMPNATYDKNLQADVGVWPEDQPLFEILVCITGQGNLNAQGTTQRILQNKPKPLFAFFLGVGGGLKDQEVGSVVYSTKVYYYESGKEVDGGVLTRPEVENSSKDLAQLAVRIPGHVWKTKAAAEASKAAPGIIASGELVLASTAADAANLQLIRNNYNDTQVVDKEAYGFLLAAAAAEVKHRMVIRGVSDLLAGKAESDAKGNQPLAAQNAAAFLFALIRAGDKLVRRKKVKKTFFGFTYDETEVRSVD